MKHRTRVTGTRSLTLWLIIFIAVVLVAGVAVGGLFILPQIQSQQNLENTRPALPSRTRRSGKRLRESICRSSSLTSTARR